MERHLTPSGASVATCDLDAACVPTHCDLCLAALPADELVSPDARDYVQHYCGLDCFAAWKRRAEAGKTPPG